MNRAAFAEWVKQAADAVEELEAPAREPVAAAEGLGSASNLPGIADARLVGSNASEALRLDQAVIAARAASDTNQELAALKDSPGTGVAMVLSLAQSAAGFNPAAPAASGSSQHFDAYVNQVLACPVFSATTHDVVNPTLSSGSWATVVNQIAGYFVGIAPADQQQIRSGLWQLGHAASSYPGVVERDTLFSQSVMNAGSSTSLTVYMYWCAVVMKTTVHKGGKNSPDTVIDQGIMNLHRAVLNMDASQWPHYAASIQGKNEASINGWLNGQTTPNGPAAVNWTCA